MQFRMRSSQMIGLVVCPAAFLGATATAVPRRPTATALAVTAGLPFCSLSACAHTGRQRCASPPAPLLPTCHRACPPPPLPQLILTLTYIDGADKYSFAMLLPGSFMALLVLGVDEVARCGRRGAGRGAQSGSAMQLRGHPRPLEQRRRGPGRPRPMLQPGGGMQLPHCCSLRLPRTGGWAALVASGCTPRAGRCCSQLEDPWRLLPIQGLVDIGMKDMQA